MGKESKQKLGRKNLWRALTGCTMALLLAVFGLVTGLVLPLSAATGATVDLPKYGWVDSEYRWSTIYPRQGNYVWEYNGDYYYSGYGTQYKLNQINMEWEKYTGWGKSFCGLYVWQYDGDYYYSSGSTQYILKEDADGKPYWDDYDGWNKSFDGDDVWQYNGDYYYSSGSKQYISKEDVNGDPYWEDYTGWGKSFYATNVWKYNGNYYYSNDDTQYKLNKDTKQWEDYTGWGNERYPISGAMDFWWYNGEYHYTNNSSYYGYRNYKLNPDTMQWERLYFNGYYIRGGRYIWECNGNYYYSNYENIRYQHILCEHSWSNNPVTVAVTCTSGGGEYYRCTKCSERYWVVSTQATGHTAGEMQITEPTCTEDGHKHQVCTVCGVTLVDEAIPATGHDWDEGTPTPCTCTEDGNTLYTCQVCGETRSEVISATGHKPAAEWTVTRESTCQVHGQEDLFCTECGASIDHREIELAEHIWGDYEIIEKPTTEHEGEKAHRCTVCGTIDEDSRTVVPKLEPKKNSAIWIIIGIAATAVGGLGVMLAFLIKRSRQKVDVEFTKKV